MAFERNWASGPQNQYLYQPGAMYQGLFYAHDPMRDFYLSGYIREVAEVSQVSTVTVTWGVDGEAIGFTFDDVTVPALALTDDNTSAGELRTAVLAYAAAHPEIISDVSVLTANAFDVTFTDKLAHDVPAAGFATGTSAVAQALLTAAASFARLDYGLGVTLDTTGDFTVSGPYVRPIRQASSGTDALLGVLGFMPGAMNSAFTREVLGGDADALIPAKAHETVVKGSVIVPWVGTLPTGPTDQVFWINDPIAAADLGKFRSDTGAAGVEADLVSGYVEGVIPAGNLVKVKFDL